MSPRRWHWQIDALGQGPDYVFKMTFAHADAHRLAQHVARHLPSQYVRHDHDPKPARHASASSYACYIDRVTHEQWQAALSNGRRPSVWFYGQIEVVDHELHIRHVLAGGQYDETALIVSLLRAPDLKLTCWHVAYAGYEWADVASGDGRAALIEYLEVA